MLSEIASVIKDTCELNPEQAVLVAVSGGPDSLCLMDIMIQAGYPIIVAHFNHKLRPESNREADSLKKMLAKKHIRSVFGSEDVSAFAKSGCLSIETAARELRYKFLFEQAIEYKAQALAVGHSADDQVETVLMHFLRGAGLRGMGGMMYRSFLPNFNENIPIVRPLLGVWREEISTYCATHELKPYQDPSNESLDFLRNRIRHELIPELETYNPRIRESILRSARSLRDDQSTMLDILDSAWKECLITETEGLVSMDGIKLSGHSRGLQRNLIRRALERVEPSLSNMRFSVLDVAAEYLATHKFGRLDLTQGVHLYLEGNLVYVARKGIELPTGGWPQMPQKQESLKLQIPGQLKLSGDWIFSSEQGPLPASALEKALNNADPFQVWLDAKRLPENMELRARRPGDRFAPLGMQAQSMKLSDFFINEKLPQRARAGWPLLCSEATVIWVPGFRPAQPFRLTEKTRHILYFAVTQNKD